MTNEQDGQDAAGRSKLPPVPSLMALVALVAYAVWTRTAPGTVATILLSLSIGLDFFVLQQQKPGSRLSSELARCEWAKIGFLAVYAWGESFPAHVWLYRIVAVIALLLSVFVALVMMFIAAEMIRSADAPSQHRRRFAGSSLWELLTDKVLALTGAIIAFLHVTYFLTFALALSDHYDKSDLWAVQYGEAIPSKIDDPPPVVPAADLDKVHKLYFDESTATMPCTTAFQAAAAKDPLLQQAVSSDVLEARVEEFKLVVTSECGNGPESLRSRRAAAWNVHELNEISSPFRTLAETTEKSYLIEIRGHANDTRLKADPNGAYGSNYEISKQRADQVSLMLSDAFHRTAHGAEEPPIRWLAYGVSNENSFLQPGHDDWISLDSKLSVEVRVQEVALSFEDVHLQTTRSELRAAKVRRRDLDLIDYLYFTVYTITTTGYGDIIPTSSYAKLIVTLANLIELLFLVVLVNVIANTCLKSAEKVSLEEST